HAIAFPGLPADFEELKRLVRTLSRTDAIFWCARLNALVTTPTDGDLKDVQGHCIGRFFERDAIDRINAFARDNGGRENVSVFFRGQLLELLRCIALLSEDREGDGTTFELPEVRLAFVRAAVLASEVWARRVYRGGFGADRLLEEERARLLSSMRVASMESGISPRPFVALARGALLFGE